MGKKSIVLLSAAAGLAAAPTLVRADVVVGPEPAVMYGLLLWIALAVVMAIAVLAWALIRKIRMKNLQPEKTGTAKKASAPAKKAAAPAKKRK